MKSDVKLIELLFFIVIILGIIFALRITFLKDVSFFPHNKNLATDNTLNETNVNRSSPNNSALSNSNEKKTEKTTKYSNYSSITESNRNRNTNRNDLPLSFLSFLISFIVLIALYYIYKNYSYSTGLLVYSIYSIIVSCLQNGFRIMPILLSVVVALIETSISYWAYKKSNSFRGFIGRLFLVGGGIIIALVVILTIIYMASSNNGILS